MSLKAILLRVLKPRPKNPVHSETQEMIRHKIVELRKQRSSHQIDESDYIEAVMTIVNRQHQYGEVKGLRRGYELVSDVRYGHKSTHNVFHTLIEECSRIEADIEIAETDERLKLEGVK